jgi:D-beta-D-heptose 7-phosphate kinase/D-beta-D-heptose 1-phosphate adenosyltransferase
MIDFSAEQRDEMIALVQAFPNAKVLCLGDVMLDRFVEGDVKRISPESPVPVFTANHEFVVAGGAANVARNIEALGGTCTLIGVVGDDEPARVLVETLSVGGGIRPVLISVTDRPTAEKVRFVTKGHHMLRVDREETKAINDEAAKAILTRLADLIEEHAVLVLSDYAKGVLTDEVVREGIAIAKRAGKPVIVDPKSANLARYAGATIISPNNKELALATGMECSAEADAIAAAHMVLQTANVESVLVTRGERGMTLVTREESAFSIPTFALEVFDVVGAGDTVVAVLALSLANKAPLRTSAILANTGAGVVVGKRGTATISPNELIVQLEAHAAGAHRTDHPVVLTIDEVIRYARARKIEGKKIGFTNGVFDIVHPGHISILQFARSSCDCLIVGINSDASVKRLKGPTRPVNSENDRATVVGAFGMVEAVTIFDNDTPLELIKAILPDVLIKGADYAVETVVGSDAVLGAGGEVLLAPLVPEASSTRIIKRAQLGKQS